MGDGVISFLFAAGFGTWVYGKMMHTTNSQRSSLTGGGVAAIGSFIVLFMLLKFVLHF